MFTGIVRAVGEITAAEPIDKQDPDAGLRLTIDAGDFELDEVQVGDSVAIQGACMTVLNHDGQAFQVDISRESLSCTAGQDGPGPVRSEEHTSELQSRGHL